MFLTVWFSRQFKRVYVVHLNVQLSVNTHRYVCVFSADQLRCAGVKCPTLPVPSCPEDSVLTKSYTPPAGCCPSITPQCTCDFRACQKPQCPSGEHRVLLSQASGQPGNCCDVFECRKGDFPFYWSPNPSSSQTLLQVNVLRLELFNVECQQERKAKSLYFSVWLLIKLNLCLKTVYIDVIQA